MSDRKTAVKTVLVVVQTIQPSQEKHELLDLSFSFLKYIFLGHLCLDWIGSEV